MTVIYSRIDAFSSTTLPSPVRHALNLSPGDALEYEIGPDGRVVIRRSPPSDETYLRALAATLGEWNTPEDAAAFDDL
jgi:bifunctional DNA-binding transcriptional regulator/antitoxin component of YhaV-PrlF toxin-antitoxin module